MHSNILHNGKIRDAREATLSAGQVGLLTGWGVFSTLRVADGVLFEFDRHCARLRRDAELLRIPIPYTNEEIGVNLQRLIEANQAYDATLRVNFIRNKGGLFEGPGQEHDVDLVAFTADLRDWGTGVRLGYVPNGRHGSSPFAGVKTTSWAFNLALYEEAHARGFDEVVLLNEAGQVSECTSANIFVIKGDRVWTPPLATSGCLPGVTRAVILEELNVPGLSISERELMPSELENCDQAFITSSTRDLLPIAAIDGAVLSQSPERFNRLREAFKSYLASYVSVRRKPVNA